MPSKLKSTLQSIFAVITIFILACLAVVLCAAALGTLVWFVSAAWHGGAS